MRLTSAGASVTRLQLAHNAQGLVTERGRYDQFGGAAAAPTSQVVFGCLVGLRAGDSITGIILRVRTAAAGTAPTKGRVGIADANGVMLAISGDLGAASNWAVGAAKLAFASPYTILADDGYFLCFVVNGTWGSTQALLVNNSSTTPNAAGAPAVSGFAPVSFQWSAQTDLPAVGASLTMTTPDATAFYIACYGTAV